MRLSKEEAIKRFRKQWRWMAKTGRRSKVDYFIESRIPNKDIPVGKCYLCEYQRFPFFISCDKCLIEWGSESCMDDGSPYTMWRSAAGEEDRKRLASLISKLPERKRENKESVPTKEIGRVN